MKRWVVPVIIALVVCLTFGVYAMYSDQRKEDTVHYCAQINGLLKDREFFTAKVEQNGLVLYDNSFEELETVPFDSYDDRVDIMGIHKTDGLIYFVLLGSVDDEWGLLFVNDESTSIISIMNGIHSLERAGVNCYYYDTRR